MADDKDLSGEARQTDLERVAATLNKRIKTLEDSLSAEIAISSRLRTMIAALPAQQSFISEVTTFHREALIPLAQLVKNILERVTAEAKPEYKEQLEKLQMFVKRVEARANHFEKQELIAKARKAAEDEQKRLEAPKVEEMMAAIASTSAKAP